MAVASHLTRPTRSSDDPGGVSLLTWPCSDWGLPCRACCQARGGLLPHLFTLTLWIKGGLFSVARSVALRRPGVTWQSALWSSDFPQHRPPPGAPRPARPTAYHGERYRSRKGRGKASARQPSQQANQAVGRESSGSLRPRRLPGEPEAVVLLEHHAFQARPVTGPQQRRRELDGVHAVQPPRPEQRQHVTRLGLGREQEERSVGQGEPLEQAEREPIGRRLGETESEVDVAPLPQHPVPERTGPLRDFVLEGPIVERQQTRLSERRVAGGGRQRGELGAPAAPPG